MSRSQAISDSVEFDGDARALAIRLAERKHYLAELRAEQYRGSPAAKYASPLELACAIDPTYVVTPALEIINEALVEIARGENDRLIVSMPPQEGKSSLVTRHGITWLLGNDPDRRISVVSYADDIAQQFSYQVRNDIVTFDGTEDNVDLGLRLRKDSKAASRWYLAYPAKGGVYSIGIGSALTGRPVEYLVIDDPVKDFRTADSLLLSELAWQWWLSVGRPRLAPGAPVVLVLTRWHEHDLAGRLLAQQEHDEKSGAAHFDRWKVVNIPAQADHDPGKGETDILGREPGDYMASARGRTLEQWQATQQVTIPRIWTALYQGRPSPASGDILKREWWRRYETPIWHQMPDGTMRVLDDRKVLMSWDLAFKDTKSSDFVVGQVWAHKGAQSWLVDQICSRLSFTDTLSAMRLLTAKWPQASVKLVEEKANGAAVIDSLKKEIAGIIAINPKESKVARASASSPFVQAGNVLLPEKSIALFDVDAFLEEATAFDKGAHDDQVDAWSQAMERIYLGPGQGRTFMDAYKKMIEIDKRTAGRTLPAELARSDERDDETKPVIALSRRACKHHWFAGTCVHCAMPQVEYARVANGA